MSYYAKIIVQNALGLLPAGLAASANQLLVDRIQGQVQERHEASMYRIERTLRNLSLLQDDGFHLPGSSIIELGTGWRGADAALFSILGARRITTVDHARWLSLDSFRHSLILIRRALDSFSEHPAIGAERQAAIERSDTAIEHAGKTPDLDSVLRQMNIDYRIAPSASPAHMRLTANSYDLFYSESVLQRIPLEDLPQSIAIACRHLMRDGGFIFHRTDQRDIHAQIHVRNGRWPLEYLKYSDFVFDNFLSGKLTSQNRMRESDFLELFRKNGIRLDYVESRIVPEDLDRIGTLKLSRRFTDKEAVDLVTRSSLIVGRKTSDRSDGPKRILVKGSMAEIER